jgi:tetratricopeptide (TPR) repeat protein
MSYTLFLLLNVNHSKEDLVQHLAARLEQTGPETFCLDRSPDLFFTVDYLTEEKDTSLCVDIPFGSEETVLKEVVDLMTYMEEIVQIQVLDPQLGQTLKPAEAVQIVGKWRELNLQALRNYADGCHFLRDVQNREGKKVMIEAIRFQEETWQNHCSVALAFARIGLAEEARTHFERALEMDPDNPEVMYALGVTYFNLKKYDQAKEVLERALSENPQNQAALELIRDCDAKIQAP